MLQQRLRSLRRNNKKGFTMVELLAVIVILCILAAILIPTFSKYVKKAENATVVAEARAAHVAASVLCQEASIKAQATNATVSYAAVTKAAINDLASLTLPANDGMTKIWTDANGTVTGFVFKHGTKYVAWAAASGMYDSDSTGGDPTGVTGTAFSPT